MSIFRRWMLGRKRAALAAFVGEKVDYLFRHVLHPSGREYTVEEVAQAIGTPTSYVLRLRRGHVANAESEVLGAVSDFFGVDHGYWFRVATYIDGDDPHYPYAARPQRELTPGEVAFMVQMLAQVQDRLSAPPGDPGAQGDDRIRL